MLIFRVQARSLSGQPDVSDSRGLAVRLACKEPDSDLAEVTLVLMDPRHKDIFDLLIHDLVGSAEEVTGEAEGLTRFLARLSNWQHMLRRLGPRGLSREAQQGLWGELWFLSQAVAPLAGFVDAITGWRGPLGADQDFQLGEICVEVKTSTATKLDRLQIASERQLDTPPDVTLLLVALSLDSRIGHGQSLVEMVESARDMASAAGCLHVLNDHLEQYGYIDEDADLYRETGYCMRSFHAYRVEQGFPRLVSGDLPLGVGDVSYSIYSAHCYRFQMDVRRANQLLKGLV